MDADDADRKLGFLPILICVIRVHLRLIS